MLPSETTDIGIDTDGGREKYVVLVERSSGDGRLTLVHATRVLRRRWRVLVSVFLAIACLTGVYAILAEPIYRSQAIVVPASDAQRGEASLGINTRALGGLGPIMGLRIAADRDKKAEILAVLQSRNFIEDFIREQNLLPILFSERWDDHRNSWADGDDEPSLADAHLRFVDDVLRVQDDEQTGLITIAIELRDRSLVAPITERLVARLNKLMRERALNDARKGLEFLMRRSEKTSTVEVQQSIYELIEIQLGKEMLAEVNEEFALRVIDRPTTPAPDQYVRPKRVLALAAGLFAGLILGCLVAFLTELASSMRLSDAPVS